jgi:hypothetical protein
MGQPMALDVLELQRSQYRHDKRNHPDILALHKNDRVKHYALHFAKYAARFDGIYCKNKSEKENAVDSVLVSLSSANTLMLRLKDFDFELTRSEAINRYKEYTAMYCDGAEKIDHAEDFWSLLREANENLFELSWFLLHLTSNHPSEQLSTRRGELAERHFYIQN